MITESGRRGAQAGNKRAQKGAEIRKPVTFRVEPGILISLEAVALREGKTRADIVNEALRAYLYPSA